LLSRMAMADKERDDQVWGDESPNFYTKVMEKPCVEKGSFMPMGGIVPVILGVVGVGVFASGMTQVDEGLNKLGADVGSIFDILVMVSEYSLVSIGIVTLYGLREKCRLGPQKCGHCECGGCIGHCCCYTCKNFLVKPIITLITLLCALVPLLTIFIINMIYVMFWSIERACDGTLEQVQKLLEDVVPGFETNSVANEVTSEIQGYCDAMEDARHGGYEAVQGLFYLVFAHFLILGYWMKYSTLGGVRRKEQITEAEVVGKSSSII